MRRRSGRSLEVPFRARRKRAACGEDSRGDRFSGGARPMNSSPLSSSPSTWQFIRETWGSARPLELVLLLTLLLLVTRTPEYWYSQAVIVILSVCGIAFRPVREAATFWLIVSGFLGAELFFHRYAADNHKYLEVYWCVALFCACSLPEGEREQVVAFNARMLIGLCLAFAVFWKAVSATYFEGASFFRFTLLTDPRFESMAQFLTSIPHAVLVANRENENLIKTAWSAGQDLTRVPLQGNSEVYPLALLLTWWTFLFEALLAVVFLWPNRPRIERVRNALLLTFGMTTYLVATVREFGWVLMILGLAQCAPGSKWARVLFFVTVLVIQVFTLPFGQIIQSVW